MINLLYHAPPKVKPQTEISSPTWLGGKHSSRVGMESPSCYHLGNWIPWRWPLTDHGVVGHGMAPTGSSSSGASHLRPLPIVVKELLPIILACAMWGTLWESMQVYCHCDNQAVVACLWSRTSKNAHCLHLLQAFVLVEACHHFHLYPVYISIKMIPGR